MDITIKHYLVHTRPSSTDDKKSVSVAVLRFTHEIEKIHFKTQWTAFHARETNHVTVFLGTSIDFFVAQCKNGCVKILLHWHSHYRAVFSQFHGRPSSIPRFFFVGRESTRIAVSVPLAEHQRMQFNVLPRTQSPWIAISIPRPSFEQLNELILENGSAALGVWLK